MPLTNAERQSRFRARKQAKLNRAITPEDVERATRIFFEGIHAATSPENPLNFDAWYAEQANRPTGGEWMDYVPDSPDVKTYAGFLPEDAEFLARVGAVVRAVRMPTRRL